MRSIHQSCSAKNRSMLLRALLLSQLEHRRIRAAGDAAPPAFASIGAPASLASSSSAGAAGSWSVDGNTITDATASRIEPRPNRATSAGEPPKPARRQRCAASRSFHGPV
jgi:hypothetical protein